jgi:hypothetical protein
LTSKEYQNYEIGLKTNEKLINSSGSALFTPVGLGGGGVI